MSEKVLDFNDADRIGTVNGVDTSRVYDVDNHALLTRISVSNLIAIQGATLDQYLIGIVERVTRGMREEVILEAEDEAGKIPIDEVQNDTVRVVLIATFHGVKGTERNVFKRGADSFPQLDRNCYVIESGNLQRLMNLLASSLPEDERLQIGKYVADSAAIALADGNRFFQRHAAILGSTGAGKSWTVALLLERAKALKFANLIVFDMHGEYKPLTKIDKKSNGFAQGFRIAGPGDLESPSNEVLFLPYWLLNREEMLAILLDRSDQNAPNQAAQFTTHVRVSKDKTLKKNKKEDVRVTFTVDSPIPYSINDLISELEADDTGTKLGAGGKDIKGDWNGKLTRFISRLKAKVEDRRYGFMFKPPTQTDEYDWLSELAISLLSSEENGSGIKVIDFSEVPSDVLPIVVGVLARLLYDIQFWVDINKRTPLTLVCDEAHLYLPVKDGIDTIELRSVEAFERIAKEGRKNGVSLLVISQRPSDVSHTILSQCNNFLVLRLTNYQDQNVVRRLMLDTMAGLTEILPLLDIGEALLLGDAVLLPTRIRLDKPNIKPDSATRDFWSEWGKLKPNVESIKAAVESMRRQTRPPST